jgi:hypothetical protein
MWGVGFLSCVCALLCGWLICTRRGRRRELELAAADAAGSLSGRCP